MSKEMEGDRMRNLRNKEEGKFTWKHGVGRRLGAALMTLVLILTGSASWQFRLIGAAQEQAYSCGLEEHSHTEDCYERVLVCGNEESEEHSHTAECYETEQVLVCGQEEAEASAGHTHTDACYGEQLICSLTEHVHTEECLQGAETNAGTIDVVPTETETNDAADADAKTTGDENAAMETAVGEPSGVAEEGAATVETVDEEAAAVEAGGEESADEETAEGSAAEEIAGASTEDEAAALEAEPGDPEAIQALADSGYFSYWSTVLAELEASQSAQSEPLSVSRLRRSLAAAPAASSVQIVEGGGSNSSDDGSVTLSKTIAGTDTENVFDITLEVTTTTNIAELYEEPDMAVVIVMDISNTMTKTYGSTTRYEAAMSAAENFIDQFAGVSNGVSQLGFVAFNSDATKIFDLTGCSTATQAVSLKNEMRTETGNIIQQYTPNSSSNNYYLTKRFTNVEAGLKMAADMLADAGNENKYIIFLSDGFPTTYIKSGYTGWNPYMNAGWNPDYSGLTKTQGTDGYFYDGLNNKECNGASYSDKAAIRAREMATAIKASGVSIFSIGVDVGGQTITGYEPEKLNNTYVIDRTSSTYEIGSADNAESFKSWLRGTATTGIGSGYYYDSTDEASLKAAYESIFQEIQSMNEQSAQAQWTVSDPLPTISGGSDTTVEFLGFYDSGDTLRVYEPNDSLIGSSVENGENTVSYVSSDSSLNWDLKNSGYTTAVSGSTTSYTYTLTYRVRLQNEAQGFTEETAYATNGAASLTYRTVTTAGGVTTFSEEKSLAFPVPTVQGYLGELSFQKVDQFSSPLTGAVFTLSHNADACGYCRGGMIPRVWPWRM